MKSEFPREDFLDLVHRHQGILYKICLAYCSSHCSREDLYQDIILQLWHSYPSFRGKSSFSTWMYRVALNTAINQTRKRSLVQLDGLAGDIPVEDAGMSDLSEEIRMLYTAITRLGKVDRAIILLWLEEHSYEDIAGIMGITVKNVSVRLVRIREKLAQIIKKLQ